MTAANRPRRLRPGSRIGVVNSSYWLEPERLERARSAFTDRGYELVLANSVGQQQFRYAGTPESRAEGIMTMFGDTSIDAIICARGGYGGNRVLPLLDFDTIRANPKIFIGYSDVTGLLSSISQRCGVVTFHGPMLSSFGKEALDYNLDTLEAVLSGRDGVCITSPPECRARVLRPGSASGPLWGGNLTLVNERLATPDQLDTDDAILLLEEVGEQIHAFDRLLQHLRSAGGLDRIRGLVVGEMCEIDEGDKPFGKNTDEIVLEACDGLDFPIVSNFPCGHGRYQATLPIAHEVELEAIDDAPCVRLPTSPVS